jgi:ribosomal protein RSM22 (predicted rRNA methylase)
MIALERAVAAALAGTTASSLSAPARQLSDDYRGRRRPATGALTQPAVAAYLATRLPATAGACRAALRAAGQALPGFAPRTQLDLGAGPGAAAWAAEDCWPTIESVTLVDSDGAMLEAGRRLRSGSPGAWTWQAADLREWAPAPSPQADLVTACYVLGELDPALAWQVAEGAWEHTAGCLLLLEPGTPAGFALIRDLRRRLLAAGAGLAAPCPHEGSCPVTEGDWCHFAARINRSAIHRQLKGERSFEDEKFSYVALVRSEPVRAPGRIVRRPIRRRRLVEVSVCRGDEIAKVSIGQSSPDYRRMAKAAWGDAVAADPA